MEGNPALVWLERGQRRGPGDVRHPRAGRDVRRNAGDRIVRNADDDEPCSRLHSETTLAQAGGDGRADAAGTDDRDAVEHVGSSSSVADTGHLKGTSATGTLACSWVAVSSL